MTNYTDAVNFYLDAYRYLVDNDYLEEILWAASIEPLEQQTAELFLWEYVWVIANAGMREQVARTIYQKVFTTHDPMVIGHPGKRAAVQRAFQEYDVWFDTLLKADDKLAYLESLPWIGPTTKYHLARNIGIDCVKPDRHLKRLAQRFGYTTPDDLCRGIMNEVGGRLGMIDLVLWRYCNLVGSQLSDTENSQRFRGHTL